MRTMTCASTARAPWRTCGWRAVALFVAVALAGGGACASRRTDSAGSQIAAAVAAGVTGGLTQAVLFTLAEIIGMRRDLTSAEGLAAARRDESQQASARARTFARSANAGRLETEAADAAAAAAEADGALADMQLELAGRLGLTGVPGSALSAAIHARLAEIEAELAAEGRR